jgi:hypothetical protein
VLVDGQLIFSKATAGRFPVDGEVEDLFAALKSAATTSVAKTTAAEPSTEKGSGGRAGVLQRLTEKFRN